MRRVALGAVTLAATVFVACLGPYTDVGEKLDGVALVIGT